MHLPGRAEARAARPLAVRFGRGCTPRGLILDAWPAGWFVVAGWAPGQACAEYRAYPDCGTH